MSRRLLALLHAKGPSDAIVQFLMRQPAFRAAHLVEVAEASLPFLESDSPVVMGGAVAAIRWMPVASPAFVDAMLRSAEQVIPHVASQSAGDLAGMLAASRDPRAHALLRRLLEEGHEQVVTALASFGDPDDLPKLGAMLAEPGQGGGAEEHLAYLPEILYKTYGDGATPYLENALHARPGRFTTRNIVWQLMAAGDPAGFQYALQAIEDKGVSRIDIIQALKAQFPELKTADDEAILAFVKERAGPER